MYREVYSFALTRRKENGHITKVVHEVEADHLPVILENFKYFLSGCSFTVDPESTLEFTEENP